MNIENFILVEHYGYLQALVGKDVCLLSWGDPYFRGSTQETCGILKQTKKGMLSGEFKVGNCFFHPAAVSKLGSTSDGTPLITLGCP